MIKAFEKIFKDKNVVSCKKIIVKNLKIINFKIFSREMILNGLLHIHNSKPRLVKDLTEHSRLKCGNISLKWEISDGLMFRIIWFTIITILMTHFCLN